jgi:O-antigen ligase
MTPDKHNKTVLLLCAMMILVPALGSPTEELLQDTLKSILVSFFALSTALVYFWNLRQQKTKVNFHALLLLPLLLMGYALGSMVWSHAYLGGVEAIRWFVFCLILFLGMNMLSSAPVTHLVWGIHIGAVIASLWTALQFWVDFSFFAQGPNPASTFVNRNFFGEFIVCTVPFSVLLLTRLRDKTSVFFLTFSLGFNVVALMQTGTRSALVCLLILLVLVPTIIYRYRSHVTSTGWRQNNCIALVIVLIATIFCLGSIPTKNLKVREESGQMNAINRALKRTLSVTKATEYSEGSFSIRAVMWKTTWRMIKANPVAGLGAGAWEVNAPIYQEASSQLETDYYAHNELLQLVAEYGLVGGVFLACIFSYLGWAAYKTWANHSEQGLQEALLRGLTLTSLLVLLLISNAGFPWRMATTGALFALSLAILVASDMRLDARGSFLLQTAQWEKRLSGWALVAMSVCSLLAVFIAQQAIECESKIVRAVKIAMTISQSGRPNDMGWRDAKSEMLKLVNEGIAINPHYRKLTPIVADALAGWGDWKNATWIWESVLESRPHVVALLANASRGELQAGNFFKAEEYIRRAQALQPKSLALATLEVMLLSQTGKEYEAGLRARELLRNDITDLDLIRTAYFLGIRNRDPELAIQALELRIKIWPAQAVDGWLKLGNIYDEPGAKNKAKAIQSYQAALAAADPRDKPAILAMVPANYRAEIQ